MTHFAPALVGLCLSVSLVAPALASPCSAQIEALSGKVTAETKDAISAGTGGQGAAAKRSGEGVTGTEGNRSGEAPQAPPEKSAEAGKGADAAQQANVALQEARAADAKGDAKACEAAVERAKSELGKAP
ncbi:hypothetical protein [Methylobacterium sp. J-076]|uniref:hypothetical protein n=1 Tax=Methylobacterium sp. J-076 TaxID=2836655 RepID=UPI001FB875E6|nr:hypothetical protein [Methylobacterium sp. J-076]MCJ2011161.1 hypothetical protein [Methylobacterium sp. J-076]